MTNSEYILFVIVFFDSGFSKVYFDCPWHLKQVSFSTAFLNLERSILLGFSCSGWIFLFTGEVSDVFTRVNERVKSISNTNTTHAGLIFAL